MAVGSLGDVSRYGLTQGAGEAVYGPSWNNQWLSGGAPAPVRPEYSLGAMPRYGQPGPYADPFPHDPTASPDGKNNYAMYGALLVGLAQAGAEAYAASKQQDLQQRMFQIAYRQGGGGNIRINDPLQSWLGNR